MFKLVNPAEVSGKFLTVLDVVGRRIEYRAEGNKVNACAFINRLIKDGDLVLVDIAAPVQEVKIPAVTQTKKSTKGASKKSSANTEKKEG